MVTATVKDLKFYPKEYWGLDYYFRSFNKLFICDILQMKEYPIFPGAFAYNNHPIYKVDIIGTVVKVEEKSKCYIYAVDDGTGVISCTCWKIAYGMSESDCSGQHQYKSLPDTLRQKARDFSDEANVVCYGLGDLVQIKGKIKVYQNRREISASFHLKMTEPMLEVVRMSELPKIYSSCYDKPFTLPHKVAEEVAMFKEEEKSGQKSEKRLVRELKEVLLKNFHEKSITETSAQSLMNFNEIGKVLCQIQKDKLDPRLEEDVKYGLVLQALTLLEDEGQVCTRSDKKDYYEVMQSKSGFDIAIQKILLKEIVKPKFSDSGCHYFHILDELHKTIQYRKVKKSSVLYCLQKLEGQSDIIRTSQNHYMPCDV